MERRTGAAEMKRDLDINPTLALGQSQLGWHLPRERYLCQRELHRRVRAGPGNFFRLPPSCACSPPGIRYGNG